MQRRATELCLRGRGEANAAAACVLRLIVPAFDPPATPVLRSGRIDMGMSQGSEAARLAKLVRSKGKGKGEGMLVFGAVRP